MIMKRSIDAMPIDVTNDPYTHLIPIVELLIVAGNTSTHEGFYFDRDGWRCDLVDPIDFDLIEKTFDLPSTILLSRENDSILCRNTWVEIKGP